MPSKLLTIPSEAVASRSDATLAILSSLNCIENRDICIALLNKADTYPADGNNKYKAEMWRRAAVLVALADFSFMNQKIIDDWRSNYQAAYGFPSRFYSSTANFIYNYVRTTLLKKEIALNKYACFPPEWRSGLLEDDVRIPLAIETIQFCSGIKPPGGFKHFPGYNICYYYESQPITAKQAYNFYDNWTNEQRDILLNAINSFIDS